MRSTTPAPVDRGAAQSIGGIVVAVPARNEMDRIGRSIRSILAAADQLPPSVTARIVIAADSCTDRTLHVVREVAGADSRVVVIEGFWRSAGGARRSAIERGVDDLRQARRNRHQIWIATTDADTVVPADWLAVQLAYAAEGADAVAGIVELYPDDDRTGRLARLFEQTYQLDAATHPHVHGANMGVRASAYEAVGGFPDLALSEDHALWNALNGSGHRCVSSPSLRVSTSARLRGRAVGGFADALRECLRSSDLAGGVGRLMTGESA